jgi:hypothetical protein
MTSALDGGEWSASLPQRKDSRYPLKRGWVGLRAGLDTEATGNILCLYQGSNPSCLVVQSVSDIILTELPQLHGIYAYL